MQILTWNLEWRSPTGRRPANASIRQELKRLNPEVVCLTETRCGWLTCDHKASSLPGEKHPARRKVVLWSRWPVSDVDRHGPSSIADLRRWCAATVHTPSGAVRVLGVVIPYAHSNVTYGTGRARPWDDHARYLDALGSTLVTRDRSVPTIVLGDFNQRLDGGPSRTPVDLRVKLRDALDGLSVVTEGLVPDDGYLLDHIAVDGLDANQVGLVPRVSADVRRCDHHGSWTEARQTA